MIYKEEGDIKIILVKRKKTAIRIGRSITVEEIESAVESMLSEAAARH